MNLLEELKRPYRQALKIKQHPEYINPTFLPIHLPGGMGDMICLIDLLKKLAEDYQIAIYTPHVDAFKYFWDVPVFSKMPDFLWHLELDSFAKFHFNPGFYEFLNKDYLALYLNHTVLMNSDPDLKSLISYDERKYFLISEKTQLHKRDFCASTLGYRLDPLEKLIAIPDFGDYITIHDGFDGTQNVSGRATKTWKWSHWNELVKALHFRYPDLKIIQLGTSTAREIDGVDQCLINKTNIPACFEYLSQSLLHIDGDSGLVHAARRLGTKSIVLWGPTPDSFYGYPDNINIRNTSTCTGSCYGLKPNWNDKCPLGYQSPLCMDDISVDQVIDQIEKAL